MSEHQTPGASGSGGAAGPHPGRTAVARREAGRRVAARWPLPGAYGVRDRLLAAYAGPDRGYHDERHLEEVLDQLDRLLAAEPSSGGGGRVDGNVLRLAAWFHDAVYDGAADDEERSARLAERELRAAGVEPEAVAEVARLVRLTARHDPAEGDLAGALLSDADLAVLASGPERYAEYVAGVRREYAHVPDTDFRRGRADVLRALLAAPSLFRTDAGRRWWEEQARANVAAELVDLDA